MPEPEASGEEVQAPTDPFEQAMSEARSEIAARASVVEPEAEAPSGTGASEAETPETPEAGTEPEAPEVDWNDPEAREAFLRDRYVTKDDVEERLRNQKRSLQGELDLARQAREREKQAEETAALLKELDDLREDDPRAFADRLERDPRAAKAIHDRATAIDPEVFRNASIAAATGLAEKLFEVRPELRPLAEANDERWSEVVNPETGGVFGWLQRTALEEGKAQGVTEFRKSKEFRDLIAEERRDAAHEALGNYGIEATPGEDVAGGAVQKPDFKGDLFAQAAWEAEQELKKAGKGRRNLDYSRLAGRR